MRFETESLIFADQEEAHATNHIRSKIWGNGTEGKCRLCKEKDETVHHIVSGCKMLCGTQYLNQHNQICKYIHWNILRDLVIEVPKSWMTHIPKETSTKDGINILWDMYILKDRKVGHNKPDIIVHAKNTRECHIIDIVVPVCRNIIRKEAEKISKYRDLGIELQKCWNL